MTQIISNPARVWAFAQAHGVTVPMIAGMKGIFGDYRIHRTVIKQIVIDSKVILGKYGYKNIAKQTVHPFFVFAIDFTVIFTATNRCETFTLNPKC